MHNTLTRLQTTFGYLTSCAFFLAFAISTLSLLPIDPLASHPANPPPTANLSVRNIQVVRGRPHYYSAKREEYAHIRFDLDADLSSLFGWNTKQVFVYVSAEYPAPEDDAAGIMGAYGRDGSSDGSAAAGSGRPGTNKAVIWDVIVSAPATPWSWANVKERYLPAKKTGKAGSDKSKKGKASKSTRDKMATMDLTKPGLLSLKNQKPKYQITDPSGVMASRSNATLTLSWNVQPWVGPLLWDRGMLEDKNGPGEGSWNLPFLRYQWRSGVVPRSPKFDFPAIKGAQKASTDRKSVV